MNDLKVAVEKNSQIGFNVVMALLGSTDGKFDRLSQTKLVDSILGSMDASGVKTYVDYLIDMAYKAKTEESCVSIILPVQYYPTNCVLQNRSGLGQCAAEVGG